MFNPNLSVDANKIIHDLTIAYIRANPPIGPGGVTSPIIYANTYKMVFEQIQNSLKTN